MSDTVEIYVYLEDEGIDVWRPTKAQILGDGRYLLQATSDYDPDLEKWEFVPGTIVSIRMRQFEGKLEQKRVAVSVV